VPSVETNTRKIVARLEREGWQSIGGGKHDRFRHPDRPGVRVVVPRHREQYPGTAYSIAKSAGWI
jgi:predicted RNA binding protein YcfA (HicA-like mRNA interferase family)